MPFRAVLIGSLVFAVLLTISIFVPYTDTFGKFGLSKHPSHWADFGSYVGGTLGPVLSFVSIIFLLLTVIHQGRTLEQQSKIHHHDSLQSIFFRIVNWKSDLKAKFEARANNKGKQFDISVLFGNMDDFENEALGDAVRSFNMPVIKRELNKRSQGIESDPVYNEYFYATAALLETASMASETGANYSDIANIIVNTQIEFNERKVLLFIAASDTQLGRRLRNPLKILGLVPTFDGSSDLIRLVLISAYGPGIISQGQQDRFRDVHYGDERG